MESMDDGLHALIAKVEDGSEFALVLVPSANSLDIRAARAIIRKISTLGGDALAFHELHAGKTGSGIYGTSDEIVDVSRRTGKRYLESRLFRTFYSDKEFRWTFAREIDVPASLVV